MYTTKRNKYAHDVHKALNNLNLYIEFSSLRNKCKQLLRYWDYNIYINNIQTSVKINQNIFENILMLKKWLLIYLGKEIDKGYDIVNWFKSYFPITYNQNSTNLPDVKYSSSIFNPSGFILIQKNR